MSQPNEKVTVTISPDLYRMLEIEAQRRDIGIGTLCRHLITKSLKHSFAGDMSLKQLVRLIGDDAQEF